MSRLFKYVVFIILLIVLMIFSDFVYADPIVTGKGEVVGKSKYEIKATFFYTNYTKRHDSDGNGNDFASGENRIGNFLPVSVLFGLSDTDEFGVVIPLYSISHQMHGSDNLKSEVLGDIFLLGKSMFIKHPDGSMSIGLGVQIPTGKSVFDLTGKKLTTGDGSWDLFIGLFSQERRGPFILYGDISYSIRFNFKANKIMGTSFNDMKITPGNALGWDIGIELPMANILSLLLEVNGRLDFAGSAEYTGSGQSATEDVKKASVPEITLEKTNRVNLLSGFQINLSNSILITPAVWIPLKTTDNYSGTTYIISLFLKF